MRDWLEQGLGYGGQRVMDRRSAVLIVDDDRALAEGVAATISALDVDTDIAHDRWTALARATERDYDAAIIEVMLPDGDGLSLVEPLRSGSPFIRVVVVTGNGTLESAMAGVRGGVLAYLLKPVSAFDLVGTVRRAIAEADLHRDRERRRVDLERSERRHRKLVESMAAGLAHEVRNPLNSASLQLAVLDRRLERGESADNTRPIAQIIQREIARLEDLVRDFLAFAKPNPLLLRAVHLAELLTAIAELIVDAIQAQARDHAGGKPRGQVILRARPGNNVVEMEIEDDGLGFFDELPVFDPLLTKDKGSGRGLSRVHRIVADHGGTIRVESRPGRTCFTVVLPCDLARPSPAP